MPQEGGQAQEKSRPKIDMKAKAHGMTRSGFLAAAAQAYL